MLAIESNMNERDDLRNRYSALNKKKLFHIIRVAIWFWEYDIK